MRGSVLILQSDTHPGYEYLIPLKAEVSVNSYHISRVGFYGKDQSEARKTGPDWPILPCKDLFLGNTTSGSDIALLKEGNITSGSDIALLKEGNITSGSDIALFFVFLFLEGKPAQPSRKCRSTCARFASAEKVSTKATSIVGKQLSGYCNGKELSNVILPTLSCNYVEPWFLVKAEWPTQSNSGVLGFGDQFLTFWRTPSWLEQTIFSTGVWNSSIENGSGS